MANLGDEQKNERERLIHDLEVHQIELETQNRYLRETQELLEHSRARYADLYDFAPITYCTFDKHGITQEINLTGASLLGVERAHLIGRPFIACVPMADKLVFVNHLRACLQSRAPCTTEVTLLPPGREPIVLQVVSAPYFGTDGALAGCRSALTDISLRKKAEDSLRLAVRMREDFLAVVSHDLRNPLSTIAMSVQVLMKQLPAAEREAKDRPYFEAISRAATRMTRLVNDLLDLSSMDAGHLSMQRAIHDVRDVVSAAVEIVQPMALEKPIRVELHLPPDPLPADCDRERIIQVLVNLLGNAIKFTPDGGTITAEAKALRDTVVCQVRNTGVGISKEQRQHLFDPYWQAERSNHEKGAGLGLSIAKGIVEVHGGKIWVDGGATDGTTFMFTLPAAKDGKSAVTPPRSSAGTSPLGQRQAAPTALSAVPGPILIVDDETDMRTSLAEILAVAGYRVVTADNGREALARLQSGEELPALILLDLVMPVMDGWTFLAERARDARLATTPVILISGQADAHKAATEFNLAGCFEKPIKVANLIRALEQLRPA